MRVSGLHATGAGLVAVPVLAVISLSGVSRDAAMLLVAGALMISSGVWGLRHLLTTGASTYLESPAELDRSSI